MKLGAENRNSVIAAVVLGLIAVFMLWRTFFSDNGPVVSGATPTPAKVTAPTTTNAGPAARRITRGRNATATRGAPGVSLDPRLRLDSLKSTEETEYKGTGRNIFRAEAEPVIPTPVVPPVGPKKTQEQATGPTIPPPPPPPPPINLKAFGLLNRPGEPRQVFLLQNDDVFVAKEGDVVNRRYKIVKINNNSVEIEDLLSNNTQTIPLSAG